MSEGNPVFEMSASQRYLDRPEFKRLGYHHRPNVPIMEEIEAFASSQGLNRQSPSFKQQTVEILSGEVKFHFFPDILASTPAHIKHERKVKGYRKLCRATGRTERITIDDCKKELKMAPYVNIVDLIDSVRIGRAIESFLDWERFKHYTLHTAGKRIPLSYAVKCEYLSLFLQDFRKGPPREILPPDTEYFNRDIDTESESEDDIWAEVIKVEQGLGSAVVKTEEEPRAKIEEAQIKIEEVSQENIEIARFEEGMKSSHAVPDFDLQEDIKEDPEAPWSGPEETMNDTEMVDESGFESHPLAHVQPHILEAATDANVDYETDIEEFINEIISTSQSGIEKYQAKKTTTLKSPDALTSQPPKRKLGQLTKNLVRALPDVSEIQRGGVALDQLSEHPHSTKGSKKKATGRNTRILRENSRALNVGVRKLRNGKAIPLDRRR